MVYLASRELTDVVLGLLPDTRRYKHNIQIRPTIGFEQFAQCQKLRSEVQRVVP
jgi:hypothetical protein